MNLSAFFFASAFLFTLVAIGFLVAIVHLLGLYWGLEPIGFFLIAIGVLWMVIGFFMAGVGVYGLFRVLATDGEVK